MAKAFEIGRVVATHNVWELMETNAEFKAFVSICLSRYISYDWGDTCEEDWKSNDLAARDGERVIAVYMIPDEIEDTFEDQLWIITEYDRSITTLLFQSDY